MMILVFAMLMIMMIGITVIKNRIAIKESRTIKYPHMIRWAYPLANKHGWEFPPVRFTY